MDVYVDFTQNWFNHPDEKVRTQLVEKLKENLLEIYKNDLDNKINRLRNLKLTGIFKIDKFGNEWSECIRCYEDGRFISTVVLCGAIAEKITCDLIEEANIHINNSKMTREQKEGFFSLTQKERINLLADFKILSHEVAGKLQQIRDKRNDYIHPEKKKPINSETDSKNMLNLLESILKKLYELVPESGQLTNINQPLKLNREKVE
ncbi:hypothetical protein COV18_01215 [Candidatus Woesearchaeota archaeon CG10_big_fil_rev_8_21_14_0_10_37_12]|nr:MAG: hypothetical protein COV18_01215 [Candidatus Woesearchaeota archaeon CG10_big_fil_rev_8_21_14_0_10_37_12]